MIEVAADGGFRPYRTVVTIRLSHKVVDFDEDATHWVQYRQLAAYPRSLFYYWLGCEFASHRSDTA